MPAVVLGRVVDVGHVGIEGASVQVEQSSEAPSPSVRETAVRVLSGRDGAFRIAVPAAMRTRGILTAAAEGYAAGRWDLGEGAERIEIVLRASFELRVHVIDRVGRAVPQARIVARDWRRIDDGIELGITDDEGVVVSRQLARPGQYNVSARHRLGSASVPIRVSREEAQLEVTLRMPESTLVRGRVVDAVGGAPVPGARVTQGMPAQGETTTDREGRFEIPLPLTFDTQASFGGLHVYATGYAPTRVDLRSAGEVEVRMHRGPRHRGRVVEAAGGPIAGATVSICRTPAASTGFGQILVTSRVSDEHGVFEFSEARVGSGVTIVIAAKGFGSTVTDVVASAEGGDLGDFALRPGLSIMASVRTRDGTPLEGCRVDISGSASALRPTASSAGSPYQEGRIDLHASTNDAGELRVVDLAPGVYRVTASPRGTAPLTKTVDLRESQEVEMRLPEDRVLQVTVVGPDGAPVPGCRVSIRGREGSGSDSTDSGGRAMLRVPPSTDVEVFVSGDALDALAQAKQRVGAQETDVRISLAKRWDVSGTVRGLLAEDVFGAEVEVASADGKWSVRTATDVTGRFHVTTPGPDLEPFVCRLTGFRSESVGGTPYLSRLGYEGRVTGVRAGEAGTLIDASRPALLEEARLLVVSPNGVGVDGARVAYLDPAVGMMSVPADENGRAVLRGLSRGQSVRVTAWPDRADPRRRGWLESLPAAVEAGGGRETTIPLRAARRIVGRVASVEGRPIQGATVELLRATLEGPVAIQQEVSGRDGAFEFLFDQMILQGDLPRLRAQASTGRSPTVTVEDGAKDAIVLVVDEGRDTRGTEAKDR